VHPEDPFCAIILLAIELAEMHCDTIILVGEIPDRAETDYGWIAHADKQGDGHNTPSHGAMQVMYFQEKPGKKTAREMFKQGCLWNTMVMSVKAKTLWALGRQCLPGMMCNFDAFLLVLRAVREGRLAPFYEARALAMLYNELAPADFSRDILQNVSRQSRVLRMEGVDWCDWGRPQRVTGSLASLGRRPLFPEDYLEAVL
jgi:mannose-1-phosphate guanylyltransferase